MPRAACRRADRRACCCPLNIVIIEDHTLIRDMLIVVCSQTLPSAKAAGAKTGAEGLELCRSLQPDLVILDVALPDGDGLDLLDAIAKAAPGAKVIALSSHTDEFTLHRAVHSRVNGFVDKNEQPLEVLSQAISTVMSGQRYFSSVAKRANANLRSDPAAFNKLLSDWETELLALFGQGLSNADVAKRVNLSAVTVKNHRCRIMAKIGVHSTPELMRYAIDKGFTRVQPGDKPTSGM
jgi:DNA-binding NarL/FixJ family response regulator